MKEKITPRQKEILTAVRLFIKTEGYPPTRLELANIFDMNPNAANDHLLALQRRGHISIVPGVSRGIRLL